MSYLRVVIDSSLNVFGSIKRHQKILPPNDMKDKCLKVNLGCGLRVAEGWLNIDGSLNAMFASWPSFMHKLLYKLSGAKNYYGLSEYCQILKNYHFVYHDLAYGLPLPSESADFIYSSHFFEHLFRDDAAKLLSDCNRVLKVDGVIRISIPDLAHAISLYSLGKKREMLEDYFFVDGKGSYLARHKYMYDFELLKNALTDAGFKQISRCDYQVGNTPDLEKLDIYPNISLFVEAIKKRVL